ncbi:hypothetical protein FRX31_029477 [Thalictrum thalictroides]|uniref:Uncharacterized protein n=1 Tax=Thalictrum thalictroides TaxID=46969 RepID=A0A7J6V7C4_THATH|nr:hypothetical protein FRX31_029477 [Thalictrum thalictroides]
MLRMTVNVFMRFWWCERKYSSFGLGAESCISPCLSCAHPRRHRKLTGSSFMSCRSGPSPIMSTSLY